VLLVNLLAALNVANVFLNKKRLENKKRKNVTKIKNVKNVFFTSMGCAGGREHWTRSSSGTCPQRAPYREEGFEAFRVPI